MSFKTELVIEGNTYHVRRFYVTIKRDMDIKGRPTSMPTWDIRVVIDSVEDTTLTSWMIDPHKQMDGKLTIFKINEDSKMKEIEFKKSYCYHMNESFNSDSSYTSCNLLISGKDIAINEAAINQNWPG